MFLNLLLKMRCIIFQPGVTNTSDNAEEINNNIDQEVILDSISLR